MADTDAYIKEAKLQLDDDNCYMKLTHDLTDIYIQRK